MQRLLRFLVVLVVITLASPAHATQSAGVQRYLTAALELRDVDGTRYALDLTATDAGTGVGYSSLLEVELTRCSSGGRCQRIGRARLALPAGAVTVSPDLTTATLRATLAGLPLVVKLTHDYADPSKSTIYGVGVDVYSVDAMTSGPSPRLGIYVLGEGTAWLGRVACPTGGRLATLQGVDREGNDVRDPRPSALSVSKSVGLALRRATC